MYEWEGDGFLHLLSEKLAAHGDRLYATEFTGNGLVGRSFAEIAVRTAAFGSFFHARGIRKGDRVACMMHTHSDYVCAILALARLGAIWVPVGVRLMAGNLDYIAAQTGLKLLLAEADCRGVIENRTVTDYEVVYRDPITGFAQTIADAAFLPETPVEPGDIFMISFTSGTTGNPKSVPVTHAMIRFAAEAAALAADVGDGDVLYMWEPFHHIGGAQLVIMPLIRDSSLALTPRFSASRFWDEVRACGATRIHHLGGILQMLLKQPARDDDKDHRVRIAWGGGCTAETWRAFEERFGVRVVECYGLTETSSIATINAEDLPGFIGRAVPWFDIRIVAQDGVTPVPPGTRGEIVIAPRPGSESALFAGYLNSEQATAEALRRGAMHTGDLGELDAEGRVRFHGRIKDTIRVRGENVSAWEIEHIIDQHQAVAACAVIPVKAEIGEADVKLFVQLNPGRQLDAAELYAWAETRLAPHQRPMHISFVESFERTPSLRIIKHRLDSTPSGDWTRK